MEGYTTSEKQDALNLLNETVAAYGPSRIAMIRKGLQFQSLNSFLAKTGITRSELAYILQVSVRTLQRHEQNRRLSPAISEKLIQLTDLFNLAKDALGQDALNITQWLRQPNRALGSETPLSLLDTQIGYLQVQNVLGRMAHGVYS